MKLKIYTTDGTQAIKQPKIRELLDKMIVFPPLQKNKPKRLSFPIEHSSLMGYAVEILLDFHLNQDLDVGETAFKYYRQFKNFVEHCEVKHQCTSDKLFLFDHDNFFRWNANPHKEVAQYYSEDIMVPLLSEVRQKYIDALLTIGNAIDQRSQTREFYAAILTVAQTYPTLRRSQIGIKRINTEITDLVEPLMFAHERMRYLFPGNHKKIVSQINLGIGRIRCRPDFVIDQTLLEAKCTNQFLTKDHVRQVVFYYLLSRLQGRKCPYKINTLQIYYGLHGELISWQAEELLPDAKVKYWMKKLKAEIE